MSSGADQFDIGPEGDPGKQVAPPVKQDPLQGLPATVKVEEASQPVALQPNDPDATGPWIKYTGVGTMRIITPADWKAALVDSDKYCEWNFLNRKRLPRSMFNDEELQYLLRRDGRFVLEDN